MQKKISIPFFLSFIILCVCCKKEVKTDLLFDEEKIIHILADMHFAKSAAKIHKAEIRDSMRLIYESQVYIINDITKKDYVELKYLLESDLNLYYDIEKKVHKYLKTAQNEKN